MDIGEYDMKKNIKYVLFTLFTMSIMTKVGATRCVVCGTDSMPIPETIPTFISRIITLLQILVPVILIITGMIKYAKVVFSGEDKEAREVNKSFIRSIILAFAVFLVVAIIKFAFGIIDKANGNTTSSNSCINCFINGKCGETYTCPTRDDDLEKWKETYNEVTNPTGNCEKLSQSACGKRDDCFWGSIDQYENQGCYSKKCGDLTTKKLCNSKNECKWNKNQKKCKYKPCADIHDSTTCGNVSGCQWGPTKNGDPGCYSK